MKNIIICTILALCLCLTACGGGGAPASQPSESVVPPTTAESTAVPDDTSQTAGTVSFATVDLEGNPITSELFAESKLTVLNVWATWCPPCVAELPHLQEVSGLFVDKGVRIVGVMQDGVDEKFAVQDDIIKTGKELLASANANYTVILPDDGLTEQLISTMQYFPTTFFIDANGQVIDVIIGANDVNGWSQKINEALDKLS